MYPILLKSTDLPQYMNQKFTRPDLTLTLGDHGGVPKVDQQSVSLEKHALTVASLLDLAPEQDVQLQRLNWTMTDPKVCRSNGQNVYQGT